MSFRYYKRFNFSSEPMEDYEISDVRNRHDVYRFFFGSAIQEVRKDDAPKFDVDVSYVNRRAAQRVSETFHIDMTDYCNSAIVESDVHLQGEKIEDSIEKLVREVNTLNKTLRLVANIAGPTGLDLSVTTIRNLKHLLDGEISMERIPATAVGWQGFMEVLGVSRTMALRLEHFVHWSDGKLEDIEEMTSELAARARASFVFDSEEIESVEEEESQLQEEPA